MEHTRRGYCVSQEDELLGEPHLSFSEKKYDMLLMIDILPKQISYTEYQLDVLPSANGDMEE